jgi:hypothetical protein
MNRAQSQSIRISPMQSQQLIQYFLDAASSWVCDGSSLEIRYVAIRRMGHLELVEASIGLGPAPHHHDLSFEVSAHDLVAGLHQASVSKAEAMALIEGATQGRLEFGAHKLCLASPEDLDAYSEMTHRDRWFCPLHLRISARRASGPGSTLISLVDVALRRAEVPFDGTEDLTKALGLDPDFTGLRAPAITLTILPPVDLVLAETSVSNNLLAATLHAHSKLDIAQVGLALRAAPGQGLAARRQAASQIEWGEPEGFLRVGTARVQMTDADSVLAMLSLGSHTVRRHWVIDPPKVRNPRLLAHAQFDSELRKIKNGLFETTESARFEEAVGILFYMLGFAAIAPMEKEAPDLIVSTPSGQLVLVECTLRIADFGAKVGKLVDRRTALSKALAAANLPGSVLAVLVCRSQRDEIAASSQVLRNFNVVLFAAEDLHSLFLKARFLSDPDGLVSEAVSSLATLDPLEKANPFTLSQSSSASTDAFR